MNHSAAIWGICINEHHGLMGWASSQNYFVGRIFICNYFIFKTMYPASISILDKHISMMPIFCLHNRGVRIMIQFHDDTGSGLEKMWFTLLLLCKGLFALPLWKVGCINHFSFKNGPSPQSQIIWVERKKLGCHKCKTCLLVTSIQFKGDLYFVLLTVT